MWAHSMAAASKTNKRTKKTPLSSYCTHKGNSTEVRSDLWVFPCAPSWFHRKDKATRKKWKIKDIHLHFWNTDVPKADTYSRTYKNNRNLNELAVQNKATEALFLCIERWVSKCILLKLRKTKKSCSPCKKWVLRWYVHTHTHICTYIHIYMHIHTQTENFPLS